MTAESEQICDICGESRAEHLSSVAGPLTCRREAIGEGHYKLVSKGYRMSGAMGGLPSDDDIYIPPVYRFEPSPIPSLYPDPLGLDDDGLELDIREMTISGPLLPPRLPARTPYHVRYPPKVDAPVCVTLEPSVVEALLSDDDTDPIVVDMTDHFDEIPTAERHRP